MDNHQLAAKLELIADLLEFENANPFRVRAYRNAARKVGDYERSLAGMVAAGEPLTAIEGVGTDLAAKLEDLIESGSTSQLAELQAAIPPGVLDLLRVPGLGAKKAAALHRELGISSLEMLQAACDAQQVRALKGFGAKTEAAIVAGLAVASQANQRRPWAEADRVVASLQAHFAKCAEIQQFTAAGSYRRGRETVGDLDLLVDATDSHTVMDHFATFSGIAETIARGETKMSVRLDDGLQVDLRVVPKASYGAALQYFTGSKDHNVTVRGLAKERGLKVSEWGVFRIEGDQEHYLAGESEAEVYAALGLPWFPPELRENRREFVWATAGDLPRLLELSDLRGDLHMHTSATDGQHTLREMADAAVALGLEYIAITDHSQRVTMARGLDPDRLRQQWREIDLLRPEFPGLTILKGIECDILEAGGMDLPDDVVAEADWVIASLHYGQQQPRSQINDRILGAIENPWVSMVAHPTGRLINRREAYEVDVEQLLAAAAKHGVLLELNANPARLDLHDVHCAQAKERGIPIVINSDAHHRDGMQVLRYGVLQARRGGLSAADVANTRPWGELSQLVRRGQRGR